MNAVKPKFLVEIIGMILQSTVEIVDAVAEPDMSQAILDKLNIISGQLNDINNQLSQLMILIPCTLQIEKYKQLYKDIKKIVDVVETYFRSNLGLTDLKLYCRDPSTGINHFYQKIKDIYTTSIDYNPKDEKTAAFFAVVQNKLLWAISQKTAAELVYYRVDITLPFLGMQSYDKKEVSKISSADVITAKNYLNEDEMKSLELLVEQYLAFAESMAQSKIVMTMNDWIQRLEMILEMNGREILNGFGKISHKLAEEKANKIYGAFNEEQKKVEYTKSLKEIEEDIKKMKKLLD